MTLVSEAKANLFLAGPCLSEINILRALIYADVFNFPLTTAEIHRYLESDGLSQGEVQVLLETSAWLQEKVQPVGDYFVLKGRDELLQHRLARAAASAGLWQPARHFGRLLAHLPFVRMVAVTGALAVDNAHAGDDIDYLLVTAPGRVWLARAGAILLVRAARLIGVQLCPNYVLSVEALEQDRRDLFVAHELVQMVPVTGRHIYWQMRQANAWADDLLPNAAGSPNDLPDESPGRWGRAWQAGLEWLLGGRLADRLEHWEQERKTRRFAKQLHQPNSAARLDEQHVQGHFNDYGHQALRDYEQRCHQLLTS